MTTGTSEITSKRVLNVAIPIVISNATYPILGAVDTGVVGQIGEAAPIGAVGIGAITLSMIFWLFGFLRMGTTGLVAQARGAGDVPETGALLVRGLMIGFAGGLLFILLQLPVFWGAFQLSPASDEVEGLARDYLGIRVYGGPAAISLYAITGWLIALERTRAVLVLQVWINGLNIVLDLWFVLGLDWGVEGVAYATLISEWSGLFLGLWLCRAAFKGDQWRDWARVFDRVKIKHMAVVNGDIMVRSLLLQLSFLTFMFLGAGLGDVTLAANQILMQFVMIIAFALDGFAFAAEALVGQALGARNRSELRRSALLSSYWALAVAVLLMIVFAIFGPWIIDVMSKAPDVQAEARVYLWWMILFPLIGLPSWMLDGIFIGATRSRDMRVAMFQSVLIYVPCLFLTVPFMGNNGLWLSMFVFVIARALTLWRYYPGLEAEATVSP